MNKLLIPLLVIFFVASSQAHTRDTSIRTTNWPEFFAHSPDFSADTSGFDSTLGQSYSFKADSSFTADTSSDASLSGGYPLLDYISYGDIDGDDREEAVIFFFTGSTAESCSFAVIRQTEHGPAFVDHGTGYKMGGIIRNDTLLIYQPVYAGWEPNCCPSSLETQFYRIKENKLSLIDFTNGGIIESAPGTVEEFYNKLSSRNYADAYDFLDEDYQTAHPFEKWLGGFKNTVSTEAEVDTMQTSDSTVHIKLTTVDSTSDGGNITSTYEGTWKLEWYDADDGWILAEPKIKLISKK
jgi:hypothetical protein